MLNIPSEILGLTKEAVALARGGRLEYFNPAARELLGGDMSGRSIASVFGEEIAGAQANCFVSATPVMGKNLVLRVTRQGDLEAIFFGSPELRPTLLNDALVFALRDNLMTGGMAMDICRLRSEELGDGELSRALASLSMSQFVLTRMLGNLTTVYEYMRGELLFEPMSMDLALFVREYTETLRQLRQDVEIIYRGPKNLFVAADPALMETVLSNLVSNCLLHALGCTHVSVSVLDCGESVVLSVSDNGCGMKPGKLHSVFERYRHDYSMSEMGGGAGLGLTAVRGVAEKHGGTLLLESKPGRGTAVRVSLHKKPAEGIVLRSGTQRSGGEIKDLLIGLAGTLDESYYTERYMD